MYMYMHMCKCMYVYAYVYVFVYVYVCVQVYAYVCVYVYAYVYVCVHKFLPKLGKQLGNTMSVNVIERVLIKALAASQLVPEEDLVDRWENGTAVKEMIKCF